uniref:sulfatase-like hydrolase/transferase n=1 Tax=Parerythrobacter lutipelagi TaxID=1964208 RepID=UPI001376302B|nr:sulfatase-like hydrolase/transferase [Parerythrobacter lutipelagi]
MLLAAVLVIDIAAWPALWAEMGASLFLRVIAAFAVLAGALLCAALVQNVVLRWTYGLVLALGAWMVLGYRFSVGTATSYFDFVTVVDARSSLIDAFALHWLGLLAAGGAALLTALAISLKPPPTARRLAVLVALIPIVAGAGIISLLVERNGQGRGIPASWQGIGYAGLYVVDSFHGLAGARSDVTIMANSAPPDRDIILIVDESVSANYLDLNAVGGAYSGLAMKRPNWSTRDFGIAASMTNCSMTTNVGLRFGAGREDFQRKIARAPSIWAYARNAGMRTVYIYGQRGGLNENYMTDAERELIDEEIYFDDIALVQRDQYIADELARRLNNGKPEFILASKAGAHFPLTGMYPAGGGRFMPEADISTLSKDEQFWKLYRNNYRNALDWSVGAFFDRLFSEAGQNPDTAMIIYTSDHGQTFYEHEDPGSITHCRKDAAMEEGAVPLVVLETGTQLDKNPKRDSNSHYQIFPELLLAMGYRVDDVVRDYGQGLGGGADDPMKFAVQMHLRLGIPPGWVKIEPEEVFRPPDRAETD